MTYRRAAQGGTFFNPDDIRPATASHQGLMSKVDKAKLDALYQAYPSCRVFHSANQSIANVTVTDVAYNSERWDTHGFHDTATNNARLTIPAGLDGLYLVGHNLEYAPNVNGERILYITHSGGANYALQRWTPGAANQQNFSVGTLVRMVAGEYLKAQTFHTAGVALNVTAVAAYSPEFWLVRLGD